MADSLFDNRYRYNFIYPRGRSGETLRAVDTMADERPVVIKRPNPNDAPPIRAGQEVSIINEREALRRLAGHPVLTELLGSGQFFVGGIPQQYIVMERAEGIIIADEVASLASAQQRLPALEMLEILDRLIDLLQAAHDQDIVYNDVDAKHLFWHREKYALKVIDWGNAVFLEGDEATSQGVSRQSDIYQMGELLYFILSGGYRVEAPRDASDDFQVDFHADSDAVDPLLQAIVTRAVHPNLRYRYASLGELQADLKRYRRPLEQERDAIVARANEKLRAPDLTRNDLLSLQASLQLAMRHNPAYPKARQAASEIEDRLRDLEVAAHLDAVKIYMEGSNWRSAAELLAQLRGRAGSKTGALVKLLLDWCLLLADCPRDSLPSLDKAIARLFEYKADNAANSLLLGRAANEEARELQWRLAERVSSRFPDVLLLRPNIHRLESAIRQLGAEGIPVDEALKILARVNQELDQAAILAEPGAGQLRDMYRDAVENLTALNANLQTLSLQHEFSERRLPLNGLTRAINAAMALADNMHVIGVSAANNPRDALAALDASRAIDPANPVWDRVEDLLSLLYEVLQNSQTYVPAADGADLEDWLVARQEELLPFADRLADDMLRAMLEGIATAKSAWERYREVIVAGDRAEACALLKKASTAVKPVSPTLSSWFNQLRSVVEKASYVERHALPGHLGRALADGWSAFDGGQLADAQRLGQQALEIARSEAEQFICQRLWRLARAMRDWVERNGVESDARTQAALIDVEDLLTDGENRVINGFAAQMPSTETYLKAMGQGLVRSFGDSNTASLRILFCQYVLSGVLDAHDGALDDARFWQEACLRALPKHAESHPGLRTLDEFISRRESLLAAQTIFAEVTGPRVTDSLGELARQLETNPQARLLAPGVACLRSLEAALQDWSDAEFRAAGGKIETALRSLTEAESNASIDLSPCRGWLMALQEALAELSVKRRSLLQDVDRQPDEPLPSVRDAIHRQADLSEDLLGYHHAQTLLGWRDTYEAFLGIFAGESRRKQKLAAMDELFRDMFIDRHPAYPLFRHWHRLVEALPEEPPEVEALLPDGEDAPGSLPARHTAEPAPEPDAVPEEASPRRLNKWAYNAAVLIAVVMVLGGLYSLARGGQLDNLLAAILPDSTPTQDAPEPDATSPPPATAASEESDAAAAALPPIESRAEAAPAIDEATAEPAPTEPPPSEIPSEVPTLASTEPPTPLPTASLPPEGLSGRQDLLALYRDAADAPFWDAALFSENGDAWKLGRDSESAGDAIFHLAAGDLLEQSYGNAAPSRLRRVEAELSLRSANPALVGDGDIYFGILLQSADGERRAGIQVQQVAANVINLALYSGDEANFISQRAASNMIARLRLERDRETGSVSAYFNDSRIGDPIALVAADEAVAPVLFVKDGGVVIGVSAWQITLD